MSEDVARTIAVVTGSAGGTALTGQTTVVDGGLVALGALAGA